MVMYINNELLMVKLGIIDTYKHVVQTRQRRNIK